MDASSLQWSKVTEVANQPRFRATAIAVAMLVLIAVFQVGNLDRKPELRELLIGAQWDTADVQRLQIACSQRGLTGFCVDGQRVLVPSDQHALFLEAATAGNAIPEDLRDETESLPDLNPFATRSQQELLNLHRKKQKIQEMVGRLPYVSRVDFEMDQAQTHALGPAHHSAVVSILTKSGTGLTDDQVDTVKQMIRGSVAELRQEDIVVIDQGTGLAYRTLAQAPGDPQVKTRQIALSKQRMYESRIREALAAYPSLCIQVHVDLQEDSPLDQVTVIPQAQFLEPQDELPTAGANGAADITLMPEPDSAQTIAAVTHLTPVTGPRVTVSIDVPQALVVSLFGLDKAGPASAANPRLTQQQRIESGFAQFKAELLQKVLLQLPPDTQSDQIAIQLQREPVTPLPAHDWASQLEVLLQNQWPSLTVLVLGLALMTVVTRGKPAPRRTGRPIRQNQDHDELSIESGCSRDTTSQELTQLIEEDPDAAAKIIESWIRDAA